MAFSIVRNGSGCSLTSRLFFFYNAAAVCNVMRHRTARKLAADAV